MTLTQLIQDQAKLNKRTGYEWQVFMDKYPDVKNLSPQANDECLMLCEMQGKRTRKLWDRYGVA